MPIFASTAADNQDDRSGAAPPGINLEAFDKAPVSFPPNAPIISRPWKPSEKPAANCLPMLVPSSVVDVTSIPSSVRIPAEMPVPSPSPTSFAIPAIFIFPEPFHHSEKGFAIISSQAILTFPKKSAFSHSAVAVKPLIFFFVLLTKSSIRFAPDSSAFSKSGICSVSHSSPFIRYGSIRSASAIFTPSNAD